MKILHVNHRDSGGGAALIGHQLHCGLREHGIESLMYVNRRSTDDDHTKEINYGMSKCLHWFTKKLSRAAEYSQFDAESEFYSLNYFSDNLHRTIDKEKPDLVHLHWIGGETMQIESVAQIKIPIVWTLHDMWPFCGAEHIVFPWKNSRWKEGYTKSNRPKSLKGIDLNRRVWERKATQWKALKMNVVAPSKWINESVDQSALTELGAFDLAQLIPHGVDLSKFFPEPANTARAELKIPSDKPVLLYGAHLINIESKGAPLLRQTLQELSADIEFTLITFGHGEYNIPSTKNKHIHFGSIKNTATLRTLYSSADLTLFPSMLESFGLIPTESIACGTPVVCFDTSGQREIIRSPGLGYRAKPFDTGDFCRGILRLLRKPNELAAMRSAARAHAERFFSKERMISDYIRLYQNLLA